MSGGTFVGMPAFPEAAHEAVGNTTLRANLRHATHTIRDKRARAVAELDDWAELREAGRRIKDHTLRHLDHYLMRLEESVVRAGGTVHWAADADEANRIVTALVKATGESEVVKVKSMATQEIGLNEALEAEGIHAYETDLAELIVQLGHDRPSHILVPAIHRNRGEIRDIFAKEMADWGRPAPEGLTDSPAELAEAARLHLREKFLRAKVGISGANFMVAETGTLVVVESEGNGRMCLTLPETLISVVGIEKTIPTWRDLEVFLQTLPRSSTAERMNPYTSMWTGTTDAATADGPSTFHLVLLDNGRTDTLADEVGRQALRCIRCSACLNVCPVYERAGGHAYGSVYPGPIGAILSPQLRGTRSEIDASLPYASSLCGACYEVCPVAIDIPEVLVHLRERVVQGGEATRQGVKVTLKPAKGHAAERAAMRAAGLAFARPGALRAGQRIASRTRRFHPRMLPGPGRAWSATRDLPKVPAEPFRDWWQRTRGDRSGGTTEGNDA
ncbi:LutB/LldF family L-lactate oxidation iron-sulfur protein [Streptomyces formicae]|uniref:Putative L-lactate dehydrogenase, Iron-sulfur cluster-binding subunit YkgF n=1 Tax=Streptomyces formicae TaxID=1616117 RepID=A0A291Q2V5_9ACTN|nr:LutB/LldF family L-lactate oxidation iron-sulfur protein [Streptomyces formicae]ATL25815.1 putative L-lactate dehydrogenase, Iron-sulfur cluster-binding subunit YkgF [Streptomyces formicae]